MHKLKRYEKLADEISALIRQGVLGPNDRIPSVRQACQTYSVSPATVFKAYYLLEDRGLIQARERSGYYVREHVRQPLAEPAMQARQPGATEVDVSELVFSVLGSLRNPHTVPFGSAFPSPDLFPLARLARSMGQSLRQLSPHAIIADQTDGNPELKRQIALRYMVSGVLLPMEELVITTGAMEALNLCLQAVTEPDDLVAIEAPAFYACLQVLERLKLKAVEIPVHPRDGIDLDSLEHSLTTLPIKACWFMSSFQNPIGASLADASKQRLSELLHQHQVPLIEDDVYAELHYGFHPPRPLKSYDNQGLFMHCGSFSKCLAPGYRVGWVAGGRYAQKIAQLKLMTTISPSVPIQAAIADYLQHGGFDRHLRKLRQALEQQQQAMLAAAARHFPQGTRVTRPAGGYFLWFEFPEQVDSLKLFELALAQGISLAPGPIFSAQRAFRNCARLNHGHPWGPSSEGAMELLGQIVRSF
ncbi:MULTISPECIES: GntR family transcriptional regulator MpaR [unclassified Pseudomonas]|uniref:GntR family transcriptional regulator MpaR n=1 Tax=unclassified Pseudomonas TaxID=196821 RepID=UPI000BC5EE26|nr:MULTISPECIES: GntR family transcriptional regulator MpaR [unclassified Pseudomonas]PVZ19802.1 DNA-binding transcriptional MocR family regulator [Pseudomonas sp. URIL14HWK12:I12]PVZ26868.1 DNA-binding transcriptional MocR family regulator [Pseudomonas sp. URIL14HWK12:I10]PVZ37757.1 DNA-binding transcriptional MocR family regulator [Pseudomonas sp. URIL14HWK12:I11]SNZ05790.1 DNA-binding transcriptional regulator, MocR family, contains an aminotransferase domain [Pseudomonas sp. URIL14HWK12:I9]